MVENCYFKLNLVRGIKFREGFDCESGRGGLGEARMARYERICVPNKGVYIDFCEVGRGYISALRLAAASTFSATRRKG